MSRAQADCTTHRAVMSLESHLGGYNSNCFIPDWEATRFRKNMAKKMKNHKFRL